MVSLGSHSLNLWLRGRIHKGMQSMVDNDKQKVHTPFVLLKSSSLCAPSVCSQDFPNPLSRSSVLTNPVEAPGIRFSFFREQHPHREKAVNKSSLFIKISDKTKGMKEIYFLRHSYVRCIYILFSVISELNASTGLQKL